LLQKIIYYFRSNRVRILRLSRESSWIATGQIASLLGSLALVKVLTGYLEPNEYGELALGLTIVGLVNQLAIGGITNGISRFYSVAVEQNDLWGYFRASGRLVGYATIGALSIALVLITGLIALNKSQWLGIAIASLIFSILSGYNSVLSAIQNAARQRGVVALHSGLESWLKICLAVALLLWLGSSSTAVMMGYALTSLILLASRFYFLNQLFIEKVSATRREQGKQWGRKMWLFAWPFMVWGIFGWIQQSSTRWALVAYSSTQDVGKFAVLSQLGYTPILLGMNFLMTFALPILYARGGDARDPKRRKDVIIITYKIAVLGVVMTAIATIMATLFHSTIFRFFTTDDYTAVSKYLPIVVAAGGIYGIAAVLGTQLLALMAVIKAMPATVISSILGALAAYICTYYLSVHGAVIAMLIHSIAYLVLISFAVYRNQNVKNEIKLTDD
jgi:O-antigen/teichoic acid export membrane protein